MTDEERKAIEILKDREYDFDELYSTFRQSFIKPYDKSIGIILELIEKQSIEIEELKDFIVKLQATKDRLDSYDKENTLEIEKLNKEIEELKEENKEIREWKYVIDNPIDLEKLKELDLIKIKGKEYISKDKIKAKIEEEKECGSVDGTNEMIIEVLQSLLEKGKY